MAKVWAWRAESGQSISDARGGLKLRGKVVVGWFPRTWLIRHWLHVERRCPVYNARVKTLVLRAAFVALPFMVVACDIGMSIHQASSPSHVSQGSATTGAPVIVNIKTRKPLIGETWYATEVDLTNTSSSPISVYKIDLSAQHKTYKNEPSSFAVYPLTVQAGSTGIVGVYFRLDEDVWTTFHQPADLLVYYRIGNEQKVASASLIGDK
jgi:hypothetical protein